MEEELQILLSASQLGTADQCERKWGYTYLDGIRSPSTASQQLGTDVHTCAEEWLGKGTPPPQNKAGRIFTKGVALLPVPGDHVLVEHAFRFVDGPLVWRGFIDFIDTSTTPIKVGDHKTTKNLRYAMDAQQLSTDNQGIIYAKVAMDKFNVDQVQLEWVYYPTTGKNTLPKKVSVVVGRDHVEKHYKTLRMKGVSLLDHKRNVSSGVDLQVEKFPHPGCRAYGGCTFQEACDQLNKGNDVSDILDRIKAMSAAKTTPAAVINPPTEPVKTVVAAPQERTVSCEDVVVPPAKVGRPKKHRALEITEEARAAESVAPSANEDSIAPEAPPVKAKAKTKRKSKDKQETKEAADTMTLFIDCMPSSGSTDVSDIIMQCAAEAASEHGVDHYRMIDFGKGPAQLNVCLERYFHGGFSKFAGSVVLCTSNQIQADSIPFFEAMADTVVRSIK